MQIIVIILIALMALPEFQPLVQGSVVEVSVLVWGTTSAFLLSALVLSRFQYRRLALTNDPRIIRQIEWMATMMRWSAVFLSIIAVMVFGWAMRVREVTGDFFILDEAVLLAPAGIILIATWWLMYPFEVRVHDARLIHSIDEGFPVTPLPSRSAWVILQVRTHLLLLLVPIVLIAVSADSGRRMVSLLVPNASEWVAILGALAGAFPMILLSPWVTLRLLDTTPLPQGEVRRALEASCTSAGVRIQNVMLWRTGGTLFNGAVTGFIPHARWVLLSDGLLERLERAEVLAVMAHELAHVRKRHMFWLAVSIVASGILFIAALDPLVQLLRQMAVDAGGSFELISQRVQWIDLAASSAVLVGSLVVFGWISRRFERQADAFAAVELSKEVDEHKGIHLFGAEAMRSALNSVARLNGVPSSRWSWRHGSILGRQKALQKLVGIRSNAIPINRLVQVINSVSMAILVLALIVWVQTMNGGGS